MWISSFVKKTRAFTAAAALALAASAASAQTSAPAVSAAKSPVRIFAPAQVQEVYRVFLDRDALLLESITQVVKEKGVTDGYVAISSGSVQECTYHFVVTTELKPTDEYKTVKAPMEILHGGGLIADGVPHLHIALSSPKLGAFGGHLEPGCKVLYLAEVTITKYKGEALTRKPNPQGIGHLTTK